LCPRAIDLHRAARYRPRIATAVPFSEPENLLICSVSQRDDAVGGLGWGGGRKSQKIAARFGVVTIGRSRSEASTTGDRGPGFGFPAAAKPRPVATAAARGAATLGAMSVSGDAFVRLESLIYRPVSTRPDWLKAWRHEAQHLLFLARRADDDDNDELFQELEDQAREMADMVEARLAAEGL